MQCLVIHMYQVKYDENTYVRCFDLVSNIELGKMSKKDYSIVHVYVLF